MEEASWSDLPQHLLEEILNRLARRQYLIFGSVCRSWRMAQTQCAYPPAAQLPFLIHHIHERGVSYVNPSENKHFTTPWPDGMTPFLKGHCLSSSHGWLLMKARNCLSSKRSKYHLFNPFVNKYNNHPFQNHIPLPKTKRTVPYLHCVFFSTPKDQDGVLLVTRSDNVFLLYRLRLNNIPYHYQWESDQLPYKWEGIDVDLVSNFVFCKGKLFALKKDWSLVFISPCFRIAGGIVRMEKYLFPPPVVMTVKSHFLVESCGEILMVTISFWSRDMTSDLRLHVFRADLIEKKWVKVESLGNRALFLSSVSSFSVCAPEMGIESNSIYYSFIGINLEPDCNPYGIKRLASDGTLHGRGNPSGIKISAWVP